MLDMRRARSVTEAGDREYGVLATRVSTGSLHYHYDGDLATLPKTPHVRY